ncbi:MAG: hydantoinase B/oxoprolinase family protein [Candidatus Tectomicrobia bacterium]
MANVDPITFEVIRNALLTTAAEMKVVVMRSSYSTIWRESGDLSCAILSRDGEMIAQGPGDLPAHLATMPFSLQGALQKHPLDTLEPGDVLFHNDPQWGNNHLPDCMMAKPVFVDADIIGFAVVRGHWTDIGGMGAGSYTAVTTDPIQEGLRIPPIKLYRAGELDQSYVDFILANVRVPRDRLGDIRAEFAGCVTGERKLLALSAKYGARTVTDCMLAILDHGEHLTRAELEQIPDGTYHYTDYSDGDGVTDEPIKIQVAVTIAGSDVTVDFTGSHPQTIGGMNAPLAVTYSSVQFAVKAAADPWNAANSGCYRPVRVIAPEGTVVNPVLPASVVAGNHETAMIIVAAIFGALAQAAPDRVVAAGADSSVVTVIAGIDPRPERHGRKYVYIEIQGSSWGATQGGDGVSAMRAGVGNTGNQPIEVVEAEYPVTVLEYSIVPDRAGAGRFRGGFPARRVVRLDGEAQVTLIAERGRIEPFGLHGGQPGALGQYLQNPGTPQEERLFSKTAPMQRQQGEVLSICAAGGGGFGSPSERDPARIQQDLEAGLVSPASAERDYGRPISPSGTTD